MPRYVGGCTTRPHEIRAWHRHGALAAEL